MFISPVLEPPKIPSISIVIKQEKPKELKPVEYTVISTDTLTSIAEAHSVPLDRLWAKNTQLTDPDVINDGEKLTIPQNDEKLEPRALPVATIPVSADNHISSVTKITNYTAGGNTYAPGYCTYGVKMWRPDIPNSWGNAYSWYSSAQAMGWPTGVTPRVGAVAWARGYSHVALVIGVEGSSVTIREMNGAGGLWSVTTRSTPVSDWLYIY